MRNGAIGHFDLCSRLQVAKITGEFTGLTDFNYSDFCRMIEAGSIERERGGKYNRGTEKRDCPLETGG